MSVKIKKLTPPQIAALRDALPASVASGTLTTTNSIATFHDRDYLAGPWRLGNVEKLLASKIGDGGPLEAVYRKVVDRPDLVEVV